jgi:hypothetical protein
MRILLRLFIMIACGLTACSGGGEGFDYRPEDDPRNVGPEGAFLQVDDPESPCDGVTVEVPAGAFPHYRTFYIAHDRLNITTTPWLPAGFSSSPRRREGAFDLKTAGDPPYDVELTLTFPVSDITAEAGEVICAFYHDRDLDRWRFVMPESNDGTTMTVVTTYRRTWNWGKVDVSVLDLEYLEPALADQWGGSGWQELVDAVDSVADDVENENINLSCASMRALQSGLLENLKQAAAARLQVHADELGTKCGTCDPLSAQFMDELGEFIDMKIETAFLELFADNVDSLVLELMARLQILVLDFEARALACDYGCVHDQLGFDFWIDLGVYYLAAGLQYMIDWGISVGAIPC